jgi:hypothetical protein
VPKLVSLHTLGKKMRFLRFRRGRGARSEPLINFNMDSNFRLHSSGLAVVAAVALASFAGRAGAAVTYDFNSNNGGFTSSLVSASFDGPWAYSAGTGSWITEGQGPENAHPNTTDLASPPVVLNSSGVVTLSFDHRWAMEGGQWDGGAVYVSVNAGLLSPVPAASFTLNGYNGTVLANSASALAGQSAFIETSAGHAAGTFLTSVANLGSFNAGDSISVHFRAAYDTNTTGGSPDWEITSVTIVPEPGAFALVGLSLLAGVGRRRRGGLIA